MCKKINGLTIDLNEISQLKRNDNDLSFSYKLKGSSINEVVKLDAATYETIVSEIENFMLAKSEKAESFPNITITPPLEKASEKPTFIEFLGVKTEKNYIKRYGLFANGTKPFEQEFKGEKGASLAIEFACGRIDTFVPSRFGSASANEILASLESQLA